jgi:hypothetical protein
MPSSLSAPPSQGISAENSSQKRSSFAVSEHKLQTYLGPQAASALSRLLFSARWNQKQSSLEGF